MYMDISLTDWYKDIVIRKKAEGGNKSVCLRQDVCNAAERD